MATDNTTGCGSVALSFYQMLASTIVGYVDIAGVTHYRINGLEVSGDCVDLHDLLDCNINHWSPERQLVENVFALDDCADHMALKTFTNSSVNVDYSECGEIPKTFIEMLARTIHGYHDIAGVMHYRINSFVETGNCDDLVDLLLCPVNDIEAERMLVENLFSVDTCDRLGIKLFTNVGAGDQRDTVVTDYSISCTTEKQSFLQMLARCIVQYSNTYRLNIIKVESTCDDAVDFWTCSNNHIDAESAMVNNLFATDECGHLALKWFTNTGE